MPSPWVRSTTGVLGNPKPAPRNALLVAAAVSLGFVVLQLVLVVGIIASWWGSRGPDAVQNTKQVPPQETAFDPKVGYYQSKGAPDGNAQSDLSFSVQDVNELLKNMTLHDGPYFKGDGR